MMYEYLGHRAHAIQDDKLNEFGKEGWEICFVQRLSGYFQFVFKRPVADKPIDPTIIPPRKRGRPPGSKNKPKPNRPD